MEDALQGTWVFNDNINTEYGNTFNVELNFICSGVSYCSIQRTYGTFGRPPVDVNFLAYYTDSSSNIQVYTDSGWIDESYKTITITSKLSEVVENGDALLAWLQVNATKQTVEEPTVQNIQINLTAKGTTTLATAGKFCDRNIDVTPVLQEVSVTPSNIAQEVTPGEGYAGIAKVTVEAIQTEELTATENGEYTPSEGKYFSKANVNVQSIVDISTADEMTALLVSENVGKVYRFTGTTDSTYTNGDLYEVVSE